MSKSILTSERITAIVSTLVAIAILAAGVTAHQSRAPLGELEQLESDLQFQLDWAFRHDSKERAVRLAKLAEAVDAWHDSPRSPADRKLLAAWLLESSIRSMPGTTKPLPSIPEFNKPIATAIAEPVESKPVETRPVETRPLETKPVETKPASVETGPVERKVVDLPPVVSETVSLTEADDESKKTTLLASATDDVAVVTVAVVDPLLFAEPHEELPKEPPAEPSAADPPQNLVSRSHEPAATSEKPVQINLTELAARIAGYHEGLDQIETALLFANSPGLDFLEQQAEKLDHLRRDFRFVKLYHEVLSEQERKHVSAPRPVNATLAEIERLLQRYESQQDGDFLGSFDPAQRTRIEKLRQRLAAIANHKK